MIVYISLTLKHALYSVQGCVNQRNCKTRGLTLAQQWTKYLTIQSEFFTHLNLFLAEAIHFKWVKIIQI